jgi:class 3 adenylate cyclase
MTEVLQTRRVERTKATVMFVDVVGFNALSEAIGPEEAYSNVTECLMMLEAIARRRSGSVDKYLGDAIMAVFGVPVAIESPELAAVRAALEMHEAVRIFNRERQPPVPLQIRIGINTGSVVSGDVSGSVIREFHVLGDPVNVAARFKDLAPLGHTYVGEETRGPSAHRFDYRYMESLAMKGKALPVATYSLLAGEPTIRGAAIGAGQLIYCNLVGRDRELGQLREAVAALSEGRGGVATLVAPEGSGKSRLVAEIGQSEEIKSVTSLECRAEALSRERPYFLIAELLGLWAGLDDADSGHSRLEVLEQAVGDLLLDASATPVLAWLMGLEVGTCP